MERLGTHTQSVRLQEAGIEFAQFLRDFVRGQRDPMYARRKAAVNAIDVSSGAGGTVSRDFLSVLSRRTLIGKIPFRRANFNERVPTEAAEGAAGWYAENAPIAISQSSWSFTTLGMTRISGIVVLTDEQVTQDSRTHLANISDAMLLTCGRYHDRALLDPSLSAIVGKNPASLTNAGTLVSGTGATLAAVMTDVQTILQMLTGMGGDAGEAVIAMHPQTAVNVARLQVGGGLAPTVGARGGELLGCPVLTTVGASAAGSPTERIIAAINPAAVVVAEGELSISTGKLSTLEMTDSPSGAAQHVSALQTGSTPVKFVRHINWSSAAGACAYLRVTF